MAVAAKFITVEGGEGVGKTTFINRLASWLESQSILLERTREPGGTEVADSIRQIFANPPATEPLQMNTELLLVCAARAQHIAHFVKPSLAKGTWVICDRFADSTRVYQGYLGGIEAQTIESVIAFATGGIEPDLTFLLDCPVDCALQRLKGRDASMNTGAKRYDEASLSFHEKLRAAHLKLAKDFPDRIHLIDASQDPDTCLQKGIEILKARFSL